MAARRALQGKGRVWGLSCVSRAGLRRPVPGLSSRPWRGCATGRRCWGGGGTRVGREREGPPPCPPSPKLSASLEQGVPPSPPRGGPVAQGNGAEGRAATPKGTGMGVTGQPTAQGGSGAKPQGVAGRLRQPRKLWRVRRIRGLGQVCHLGAATPKEARGRSPRGGAGPAGPGGSGPGRQVRRPGRWGCRGGLSPGHPSHRRSAGTCRPGRSPRTPPPCAPPRSTGS